MAHEFGFRPTEWGEDRPHRSNGEHPVVFEVRPEVPVAELLRQPDSLPTAPPSSSITTNRTLVPGCTSTP